MGSDESTGTGTDPGTDTSAAATAAAIPGTLTGTDPEESDIQAPGAVDPAQVAPRRGRGRPRKVQVEGAALSPAAPPRKKRMPDADFAGMLVMIHMGVGALLNAPELVIRDDEAKVLAESFNKMASAFDWGIGAVSPKVEAVISATMAVTTVYGPRVMGVMARAKKPKPQLVPNRPIQAMPPKAPVPVPVPRPEHKDVDDVFLSSAGAD